MTGSQPTKARVVVWNEIDAIGTLETAEGDTVRFGATACIGFRPAVGVECWIVETRPDPLHPGRLRAVVVNLTGAVESSTRDAAERFLHAQESVPSAEPSARISRRDAFWKDVPRTTAGEIAWPRDGAQRATLVDEVVGATWIGACDHVLQSTLDLVNGLSPRPGHPDFERLRANAEVLRTLDESQRRAVNEVIGELARSLMYWGLAKVDRLPGANVALRVEPRDEAGAALGSIDIAELHTRFHDWRDRFADAMRNP